MAAPDWNSLNNVNLDQFRRSTADTGVNQARYNRPTTHGPFGSTTVGADGSLTSGFTGAFGQLNDNLTTQAANAAANPMDWGQFGQMGTGEDAGRQTAQAAYSQSLSRLNPQWQKSEKQLRTNLFQTGGADSDGGDATMGEFGRARNDAYAGAMSGALRQGMQAQQSAFQGNMASRQQGVANALRGQLQPFEELGGMQQFLQQPDVGMDNTMLQRDASYNNLAPVTAQAGLEQETTNHLLQSQPDVFGDRAWDKTPGGGARRRAAWDKTDPRSRTLATQLFAGPMNIDPEWKP